MSATLSLKLSADSSDEEMEVDNHLNADSSDDEIVDKNVSVKKVLTADSSDEDIIDKKGPVKNVLASQSSDDEGVVVKNDADSSDEEAVQAKCIKKKPKALVDSDDSDNGDNEGSQVDAASSEEETEVTSQKKKSKIKRPLDSDSENEHSENIKKDEKNNLDSSNPLKNRDLYDAESSDEELPDLKSTSQTRHSSEDERDNNYSDGEDVSESLDDIKKKVLSKHKDSKKESKERKSKSNAMDEIRSESQRMVRESTIGLKYHRPKQRTLEEFLNRKKGTDDKLNRIFADKHIRFNKHDSEVDKLLIERQKKIEEFYKSDTDEEDKVEKNKEAVNDLEENCAVAPEDNKASDSGILTGVETSDDSNPATDEQKTMPDIPAEENNDKSIKNENNATKDEDDKKGVETSICEKAASATEDDMVNSTEELKKASVADPDSLHLVLEPDTPEIEDDAIFGNSQIETKKKTENATTPAEYRLALLRSKFDVSQLEESLNFSPKIGFGNSLSTNNVFEEERTKVKLSTGAEKLFKRLVSHARTTTDGKSEVCEKTVDLTIVKKVVNAEGQEVLEKEVIAYNSTVEKKTTVSAKSFLLMKEKLKKKMMEKRNAERKRRAEMMKMENEEGFEADEDILDEEEMDEDADDEEEESEGESEPEEENDIPMVDKKRKSNAYLDEEAEESDEDEGEDDLHLQLDDDDSLIEPVTKKSQFSKIKEPELLSESSTNSDIFKLDSIRCQVETPTLALTRGGSTAPSSCVSNLSSTSSMAAILQSEPRWTPFQDRVDAEGREITSADNSMADTSPTASQQARKKLGFEGLFDGTDPDVEDVDDVVGLCSGKFISQVDRPLSPATQVDRPLSPATQATQNVKLQEMALKNVESQDTVIFESDSRPGSSLSSRVRACGGGTLPIESQDTVILTGNTDVKDNVSSAISRLDKLLGMDQQDEQKDEEKARIVMSDDEAARPAPGFMEHHTGFRSTDDEEAEEAVEKKKTKKRKRRILSDSEEDGDEESNGAREMSEEESAEEKIDDVEYDSDENVVPKKETFAGLFSKKGMLKNFVEKEADLSGSDASEDEDEKGLDVLEMEEGDLDDIDEDDVRDQVGRIHNKVILDEDQAEIKLFQERFLEDGEDHDDQKRERQFKWKGMDDDIELDIRKSDDEDETETHREMEEKMRKERVERETWLLQNQEKVQEEVLDKEEKDSQFFQVAEKVMSRMASREEKNTEEKEDGSVFKSPKTKAGPLQPLQLSVNARVRGSFLARGEKSLKILAEKNKLGGDTKTGTGAKASRNFVFARISPVKQEEPVSPTDEKKMKKRQKVKPPPAKRVKLDRTLDASKKGTVFNLL